VSSRGPEPRGRDYRGAWPRLASPATIGETGPKPLVPNPKVPRRTGIGWRPSGVVARLLGGMSSLADTLAILTPTPQPRQNAGRERSESLQKPEKDRHWLVAVCRGGPAAGRHEFAR